MSKIDEFFNTSGGIITKKSSASGSKIDQFFATMENPKVFGESSTYQFSKETTKSDVVRFQKANGLVPDGIVGPLTKGALQKAGKIASDATSSPYKLSGPTVISQAPEKKWPLGFAGEAAKAAYTTAKDTIEGAAGKIDDFLGTLTAQDRAKNPFGEDYTKTTGQTIGMTPEQRKEYYEGKKKEGAPLNKFAKGGQAVLGIANIAFLPVTTQIEAAKKVPVLKYPAEAASFIFEKLGEAGEWALGKAVDYSPISDESKETIRPFATELGAFTTQLVGIKVGFKLAKTGGAKVVDKLPVSEKTKGKIETGVKVGVGLSMTPFTTAYGLASAKLSQKLHERQQANIPITKEESKKIIEEIKKELPDEIAKDEVIEKLNIEKVDTATSKKNQTAEIMQNKPQDMRTVMENLSTRYSNDQVVEIMKDLFNKNESGIFTPREVVDSIQNVESGGFKITEIPPVEIPFNSSGVAKTAEIKPTRVAQTTPEPIVTPKVENTTKEVKIELKEAPTASAPKPIETKGEEQLKSRVFERMKADHPFNIPELGKDLGYDPIKLKKDAENAVDLIAKDKQKAYDIAMGKETSTEVTSTAVNIALAEKALQEKNYDLYAKLIKNRSLEQTRRGQELVAEKGSITDNSTSKYVKELIASRLEALGKRYLSDLRNTLGKTTDKSNATRVIEREVEKMEKQIKNKKLDTKTALSLLDKLTCI